MLTLGATLTVLALAHGPTYMYLAGVKSDDTDSRDGDVHRLAAVSSSDLGAQRQAEAAWGGGAGQQTIYSVFDYGAAGDGKANDTAAIQRTIDAAGGGNRGVVWLPANGTYLLGGGLHLLGHGYDGVALQVDGAVTIPTPAWSTKAQAGLVNNQTGVKGLGFPGDLASQVLLVINVDDFRFGGHGTFTGFLFDEHKCAPTRAVPKPCPPGGFSMTNCTGVLVEDLVTSIEEQHFAMDKSHSGHLWKRIIVQQKTRIHFLIGQSPS